MMIPRPILRHRIQSALQRSRVVVLVGPRQCGKTTLARTFVSPESLNYFDLEDPVSLARLKLHEKAHVEDPFPDQLAGRVSVASLPG